MCVPVIKTDFYPDYFFDKLEASGYVEELNLGSSLKDGQIVQSKFVPLI